MASTVATVLFVLMMITSSTGGGDLLEAAAPAARSAGGSSAGGELAPSRSAASGGGTGGEFMPGSPRGSATAAVSALARQLAELGNNCSSGTDCFLCVFDNIAPCVADAFTCVDDPWVMLKCFFGKITFIKQICFGSGGGSKKGPLTELVVVPAGSTGGATTRTTTRAHLSALLRNEVAILPDVGINCSGDCVECLTDSIGPCIVDGVFCFIPFELVLCLVDKYKIIKGCFGI